MRGGQLKLYSIGIQFWISSRKSLPVTLQDHQLLNLQNLVVVNQMVHTPVPPALGIKVESLSSPLFGYLFPVLPEKPLFRPSGSAPSFFISLRCSAARNTCRNSNKSSKKLANLKTNKPIGIHVKTGNFEKIDSWSL